MKLELYKVYIVIYFNEFVEFEVLIFFFFDGIYGICFFIVDFLVGYLIIDFGVEDGCSFFFINVVDFYFNEYGVKVSFVVGIFWIFFVLFDKKIIKVVKLIIVSFFCE